MRREVVGVDGDAGPLHVGQHVDQRQLDVAQQRGGAAPVQVGVERVGQLGGGAGAQHQRGRRLRRARLLARQVERELAGVGRRRRRSSLPR